MSSIEDNLSKVLAQIAASGGRPGISLTRYRRAERATVEAQADVYSTGGNSLVLLRQLDQNGKLHSFDVFVPIVDSNDILAMQLAIRDHLQR